MAEDSRRSIWDIFNDVESSRLAHEDVTSCTSDGGEDHIPGDVGTDGIHGNQTIKTEPPGGDEESDNNIKDDAKSTVSMVSESSNKDKKPAVMPSSMLSLDIIRNKLKLGIKTPPPVTVKTEPVSMDEGEGDPEKPKSKRHTGPRKNAKYDLKTREKWREMKRRQRERDKLRLLEGEGMNDASKTACNHDENENGSEKGDCNGTTPDAEAAASNTASDDSDVPTNNQSDTSLTDSQSQPGTPAKDGEGKQAQTGSDTLDKLVPNISSDENESSVRNDLKQSPVKKEQGTPMQRQSKRARRKSAKLQEQENKPVLKSPKSQDSRVDDIINAVASGSIGGEATDTCQLETNSTLNLPDVELHEDDLPEHVTTSVDESNQKTHKAEIAISVEHNRKIDSITESLSKKLDDIINSVIDATMHEDEDLVADLEKTNSVKYTVTEEPETDSSLVSPDSARCSKRARRKPAKFQEDDEKVDVKSPTQKMDNVSKILDQVASDYRSTEIDPNQSDVPDFPLPKPSPRKQNLAKQQLTNNQSTSPSEPTSTVKGVPDAVGNTTACLAAITDENTSNAGRSKRMRRKPAKYQDDDILMADLLKLLTSDIDSVDAVINAVAHDGLGIIPTDIEDCVMSLKESTIRTRQVRRKSAPKPVAEEHDDATAESISGSQQDNKKSPVIKPVEGTSGINGIHTGVTSSSPGHKDCQITHMNNPIEEELNQYIEGVDENDLIYQGSVLSSDDAMASPVVEGVDCGPYQEDQPTEMQIISEDSDDGVLIIAEEKSTAHSHESPMCHCDTDDQSIPEDNDVKNSDNHHKTDVCQCDDSKPLVIELADDDETGNSVSDKTNTGSIMRHSSMPDVVPYSEQINANLRKTGISPGGSDPDLMSLNRQESTSQSRKPPSERNRVGRTSADETPLDLSRKEEFIECVDLTDSPCGTDGEDKPLDLSVKKTTNCSSVCQDMAVCPHQSSQAGNRELDKNHIFDPFRLPGKQARQVSPVRPHIRGKPVRVAQSSQNVGQTPMISILRLGNNPGVTNPPSGPLISILETPGTNKSQPRPIITVVEKELSGTTKPMFGKGPMVSLLDKHTSKLSKITKVDTPRQDYSVFSVKRLDIPEMKTPTTQVQVVHLNDKPNLPNSFRISGGTIGTICTSKTTTTPSSRHSSMTKISPIASATVLNIPNYPTISRPSGSSTILSGDTRGYRAVPTAHVRPSKVGVSGCTNPTPSPISNTAAIRKILQEPPKLTSPPPVSRRNRDSSSDESHLMPVLSPHHDTHGDGQTKAAENILDITPPPPALIRQQYPSPVQAKNDVIDITSDDEIILQSPKEVRQKNLCKALGIRSLAIEQSGLTSTDKTIASDCGVSATATTTTCVTTAKQTSAFVATTVSATTDSSINSASVKRSSSAVSESLSVSSVSSEAGTSTSSAFMSSDSRLSAFIPSENANNHAQLADLAMFTSHMRSLKRYSQHDITNTRYYESMFGQSHPSNSTSDGGLTEESKNNALSSAFPKMQLSNDWKKDMIGYKVNNLRIPKKLVCLPKSTPANFMENIERFIPSNRSNSQTKKRKKNNSGSSSNDEQEKKRRNRKKEILDSWLDIKPVERNTYQICLTTVSAADAREAVNALTLPPPTSPITSGDEHDDNGSVNEDDSVQDDECVLDDDFVKCASTSSSTGNNTSKTRKGCSASKQHAALSPARNKLFSYPSKKKKVPTATLR